MYRLGQYIPKTSKCMFRNVFCNYIVQNKCNILPVICKILFLVKKFFQAVDSNTIFNLYCIFFIFCFIFFLFPGFYISKIICQYVAILFNLKQEWFKNEDCYFDTLTFISESLSTFKFIITWTTIVDYCLIFVEFPKKIEDIYGVAHQVNSIPLFSSMFYQLIL